MSLLELADIAFELFEHTQPVVGTVFLFGTLSHLIRLGTSIYASQCTMLVTRVGIKWAGVKVCPLPFKLSHEIIGTSGRYAKELACWYRNVYSSDTQGLTGTWKFMVNTFTSNSKNEEPMRYEESYCILLPTSYSNSASTTAQHFVNRSSTATTVTAFTATECMEIVHSLGSELGRDFSVLLSSQDFLFRAQG